MRVSMAIVHDTASMHYCPRVLPVSHDPSRSQYQTKFGMALHPPSWAVPSFLGLDVIVLSVLVQNQIRKFSASSLLGGPELFGAGCFLLSFRCLYLRVSPDPERPLCTTQCRCIIALCRSRHGVDMR